MIMADKLRVGVIGAGRWANRAHLPGFTRSPLSEVVALCDMNRELAKQRAKEFGIPDVYSDARDMIGRNDIDVIDVCTRGGPPTTRTTMRGSSSRPWRRISMYCVRSRWLTTTGKPGRPIGWRSRRG